MWWYFKIFIKLNKVFRNLREMYSFELEWFKLLSFYRVVYLSYSEFMKFKFFIEVFFLKINLKVIVKNC